VTLEATVYDDLRDHRVAAGAQGILHDFNLAGVLESSDIHVAMRLASLSGETNEDLLLAAALSIRAVRSGSVCLDLDTAPDIAPDLSFPEPTAWKGAITGSPLTEQGVLHLDGDLLYLDRYWAEERQVVADLQARAEAPAVDDQVLAAALAAYFPDDKYADQRAAAATAVRHRTSVITGGPGTGKTSTVARLLGVLMQLHAATDDGDRPLRVALAAPTGKAAARMVQAVHESTTQRGFPRDGKQAQRAVTTIESLKASTLHRLLGWTPNSTRFRHHRGNRLPYDVVVVDETSMLSLTMMARLLEAVRPAARLVLVGDADQLASVDAGAVLQDLVEGYRGAPVERPAASVERPAPSVELVQTPAREVVVELVETPVAQLSESRRFGERIGALATAIRNGDVDAVMDGLRTGSAEVIWTDADELPPLLTERAVALRRAAESGGTGRALEELDRHRLLCAHREGPYGVSHWNQVVEHLLREATDRDVVRDWYVGRPFVVNTNDYGLSLWNGDTGVACRSGATLVAVVGDAAGSRGLPTSRLADVTTAHAMTVHRSQGSQFDEVTVLLPEADSRILTRELLYTAVTRAKELVRVVGTEDAIRAAVTRRAQRATGLARRLGR
jgi:exodeoxyribonuclease V alpha subunit